MMTSQCFSIVAVFSLLFQQAFVKSAVEECSGEAEYSILGMMLRQHIFKTITGAPLGNVCWRECYLDDRCQSFNYVISQNTCELNNRTKEARPEDFVPTSDRYYFKRAKDRVRLGSNPDLPAESCKEIKASEGEWAVNGNYWLLFLEIEKILPTYCDMKTEDADECIASESLCDVNAYCENTLGSYRCLCKPGFSGDGRTCNDIDECSSNYHSCDVNAVCSNTHGSHTCTCKAGYTGDGKNCSDIDECVSGVHDCHSSASCTNTVGSFNCSCNNPFTGDGKTCNLVAECQNYQTLTNADRNVKYGFTFPTCDDGLSGWYRFQGAAGTRMSRWCPPGTQYALICNTDIPGWLVDEHPTVAEGSATKQVCFHWLNNCCRWSIYIEVRNCSSFYVYYFNGTPTCRARYCGTD